MSNQDGGPAFPHLTGHLDAEGLYHNLGEYGGHESGMSLRDWFAGQVISPMLVQAYGQTPNILAEKAFAIADAMLAARTNE